MMDMRIKHIMVLFLSDIKTVLQSGSVQISKAIYDEFADTPLGTETYFTNESALRYVQQHGWTGGNKRHEPIPTLDRLFVIASKKVREEDVRQQDRQTKQWYAYQDEQGQTYTHLGYFKRRLQDLHILDDMDTQLHVFAYDEDADAGKSMQAIIGYADEIQRHIASQSPSSCILHADMTGGMRNVSMVMVELMRYMQYNGVTVGHVLYSNYAGGKGHVEEQADIYRFFDLIAGAEEFTRFGSVEGLKDYFQAFPQKSPKLSSLLERMEHFADEMRLCHRGGFDRAIADLQEGLEQFEQRNRAATDNTIADALMELLIPRIKKDYEVLWKKDAIARIRWCLKRQYLQQALTLYIETIPEYILEHHIICLTALGEQEIKKKKKRDNRSKAFLTINIYDCLHEDHRERSDRIHAWCEEHDDVDYHNDEEATRALQSLRSLFLIEADRQKTRKADNNVSIHAVQKIYRDTIKHTIEACIPHTKKTIKAYTDQPEPLRMEQAAKWMNQLKTAVNGLHEK